VNALVDVLALLVVDVFDIFDMFDIFELRQFEFTFALAFALLLAPGVTGDTPAEVGEVVNGT